MNIITDSLCIHFLSLSRKVKCTHMLNTIMGYVTVMGRMRKKENI